ncbi:MAG: response regulator [Lachnospiraceae bacterium]|nr:response regulator [Lachnospiraceae bacterium]
MNIIAVDDEKIALEGVLKALKNTVPDAEITGFSKADDAYLFARGHEVDVALLDISMRGENGVDLAGKLQQIYPKVNIIFTTGYDHYAVDAFKLHASGYILKPVTTEKLKQEFSHLRFDHSQVNERDIRRLVIRTFGNFEVFVDGMPVKFQYRKTKELLAYLVDRKGAFCSMKELMSVLWEDDDGDHSSYLKNVRSDLMNTLKSYDCDDVIVKQRGQMAIVPSRITCDYYSYLKAKGEGYNGEYMTQFSWAENTQAGLFFDD